jgi:hypothetical protein
MNFITYRVFHDEDTATEFTTFLEVNQIPFQVSINKPDLENTYAPRLYDQDIYVKVDQKDFERLNRLLEAEAKTQADLMNTDYYLFQFTDDELFEIIIKPDEWNVFDYTLSQRILKERGKEIGADTIELLRKQRLKEQARTEDVNGAWIFLGYVAAVLGGLLGLVIGYLLITQTRTLSNGEKVPVYSVKDRKHGLYILSMGICAFLFILVFKIYEIPE